MNQLSEQMWRIINNGASNERVKKVKRITQRYINNIKNTQSYKNDDRLQRAAYYNEGDLDKYGRINRMIENRQYSRRTYMGLSNG